MRANVRARARKSLGQHWLADRKYLWRIVAAADIEPGDTVVEVGAGTGLLTLELAAAAPRLVAVEIDERLIDELRGRFAGSPNVTILQGDALETPVEEMLRAADGGLPYVVVGNLPYFAGTAIVRRFLRERLRPRRLVVTLQLEVARNMAAGPGKMSYLAVETQFFADARALFKIPARAFRPAPKVDSAVVRLDVHESPAVEVDDVEGFLALVRAGFAAPRKRLRNSLAVGLRTAPAGAEETVRRAGLDPGVRPAELSLEEWKRLYFAYRAWGANE